MVLFSLYYNHSCVAKSHTFCLRISFFFPKDSYLGALRLFLRVSAGASASRSIFPPAELLSAKSRSPEILGAPLFAGRRNFSRACVQFVIPRPRPDPISSTQRCRRGRGWILSTPRSPRGGDGIFPTQRVLRSGDPILPTQRVYTPHSKPRPPLQTPGPHSYR